jgi:SAM-dependent methyltransferase
LWWWGGGGGRPPIPFNLNAPFPPIQYQDNTFDIVLAYSVFSHLSENAHQAWLKEFRRILKPHGLLIVTVRQKTFLDQVELLSNNTNINEYESMLVKIFCSSNIKEKYDNGYYIYNPSGGGAELTNDFYGDTVIPPKYIVDVWGSLFAIIESFDDPARVPQALYVLQKN